MGVKFATLSKYWISIFVLVLMGYTTNVVAESVANNKQSNKHNQQQLDLATSALTSNCKPLFNQYKDDIDSFKVKIHELKSCDFDYLCEDYGWKGYYTYTVKLKEGARRIPKDLRAWGHNLFFNVGGPEKPGLIIKKFPQLCGINPLKEGDVFVPIPSLKSLFDHVVFVSRKVDPDDSFWQ